MALGDDFSEVLASAQGGDEGAWRLLYDELSGPLLGYLRANGAREAEEVLGDVFLQLASHLPTFEGNEGALRGWAFLVARNRLIDERRRHTRRPTEPLTGGETDRRGGDTELDALASLGLGRVGELLADLTPEQREVLTLRVVADLPLEEVARIVGRRVGAVKQLQHRALAALRRRIEREGVSP